MENEYVQDELTSAFFEESQITSYDILEDEIIEKLNSSDLVVDQSVNSNDDQDIFLEVLPLNIL